MEFDKNEIARLRSAYNDLVMRRSVRDRHMAITTNWSGCCVLSDVKIASKQAHRL